MNTVLRVLPFLIWFTLWLLGGVWMVRRAFRLADHEELLLGAAFGLVVETWLANLLGQALPLPGAFWAAALLTLALGIAFNFSTKWNWRDWFSFHLPVGQWLTFGLLVAVFYGMGRGLGIFDDYQNLPLTSMLAVGDIPLHFPLDPSLKYGYHYFLLLLAAQFMRVGQMHVWSALDLSRAISFGLAVMFAGFYARRLVHSRLAGVLSGLMVAFAGGARWLFLLMPEGLVQRVSAEVKLIGSGIQSGPNLQTALSQQWMVEGGAPLPFPFAFANAVDPPMILGHSGTGSIAPAAMFMLLLVFNRRKSWHAWVLMGVLLASLALMNEVFFVLLGAGLGLVALASVLRKRSLRLPKEMWIWLGVAAASAVVAYLQGGVLSGLGGSALSGAGEEGAYFSFNFSLVWPPALVSAHLGVLSFANPGQALAALFEVGPVIFLFPLVLIFGWKALRRDRWMEASVAAMACLSLLMTLVRYSGLAGPTAITRAQALVLWVCIWWAVPLLWMWAGRRSETIKIAAGALCGVAMFGGFVLLGIELTAMQKPIYAPFLGDLDVQAERDYWNRLEPGALVFDPQPSRAPVLFARATDSSKSWYSQKESWVRLQQDPDPSALRAAGFSYIYYDLRYWNGLTPVQQAKLTVPCVELLKEYEDWQHDFRRLADIRTCP